jgi:prevent-host-death family protein
MNPWQLQEAKSKFSQLVDQALAHGPQIVTRRGVESVVILSKEKYIELTRKDTTLLDDLLSMPKVQLDLERNEKPAIPNVSYPQSF